MQFETGRDSTTRHANLDALLLTPLDSATPLSSDHRPARGTYLVDTIHASTDTLRQVAENCEPALRQPSATEPSLQAVLLAQANIRALRSMK